MKRREFIRTTATAIPAMSLFPAGLTDISREIVPGKMEKRSLGRTGEMLSMIGFGGIVVTDTTPEKASEMVRLAIDNGVNYFDVAPSYGNAEIMLGPALEPYRKDVFLACKTTERKKDKARAELEQSLRNLRTDHFDLYQLHAVTDVKDVDVIFDKDGAIETFKEARNEGKVRFLGFSAHSVEAAMALMDRFDFDTILFPFNYSTWTAGNFGPQVMARAQQKKMGILALKAMAKGPWQEGADRTRYPKCWYEPLVDDDEILMGLGFTLSHPVTSAVPPGDETLYRKALSLSGKIHPLEDEEIRLIKDKGLKQIPLFTYPTA